MAHVKLFRFEGRIEIRGRLNGANLKRRRRRERQKEIIHCLVLYLSGRITVWFWLDVCVCDAANKEIFGKTRDKGEGDGRAG